MSNQEQPISVQEEEAVTQVVHAADLPNIIGSSATIGIYEEW